MHPTLIRPWANAADAAAKVLDYVNGPAGLSSTVLTFYTNDTEIGNIKEGSNPAEIIWRENLATSNKAIAESSNYPPLYGRYINPTRISLTHSHGLSHQRQEKRM